MTVRFRWTAILALLAATVFLVLALAPGSAAAASFPEEKGVSVGAFGGASFPFEGSYKTGFLVGASGDYNFSKSFAARVSFSWASNGTTVDGGGSFSAGQFLASAVWNFGGERLVPFATAGAGFYSISPPEGGSAGRLGLHAGGGVEYFLDRRTSVLGQGLFHFVNGVSDRGGSSFQAAVGIRYYF
jgi:predicted porin